MNKIIGRKEELGTLEDAFSSKQSEFIAVYGRRRVGKTFLIHHYFSSTQSIYFHVTGIKNGSYKEQLEAFNIVLSNTFYSGAKLQSPQDWLQAFEMLNKAIEGLSKNTKIVLFFDEFPWMVSRRSKLLNVLEYNWNHTWAFHGRIKLIICGSSSSWILRNIINNTEGLYNRVTVRIKLEPFNLTETREFLKYKNINLNYKHVADLYMVMGGIPFYLSQVPKGCSVPQVIDRLFFNKNSTLYNEYKFLLAALFEHSEDHDRILRIIAKYRYGVSQAELLRKKGISRGGRSIRRLNELEEVGFIKSFVPMNRKEKGKYYKIIDEYILFYFHWIEHSTKTASRNKNIWQALMRTANWKVWSGYEFESLCFKHSERIADKLHIPESSSIYAWRSSQVDELIKHGAQIDMLFDRDDNAITICEIKYCEKIFEINKEDFVKFRNKIEVFKAKTKTKKQILFAMVVANGMKDNQYAKEIVDNVVTLEDLFE